VRADKVGEEVGVTGSAEEDEAESKEEGEEADDVSKSSLEKFGIFDDS